MVGSFGKKEYGLVGKYIGKAVLIKFVLYGSDGDYKRKTI